VAQSGFETGVDLVAFWLVAYPLALSQMPLDGFVDQIGETGAVMVHGSEYPPDSLSEIPGVVIGRSRF